MKTVPASPIQQRFWLQAQLDAANSAYSVGFCHRAEGLLDLEALQAAIDLLHQAEKEELQKNMQAPKGAPKVKGAPKAKGALKPEKQGATAATQATDGADGTDTSADPDKQGGGVPGRGRPP